MNANYSKLWIFAITSSLIAFALLITPLVGSLLPSSVGCSLGKVGAQDNPCLQQEATLSALGFQATFSAVSWQSTVTALEAQIATLQTGSVSSFTPVPDLPTVATTVPTVAVSATPANTNTPAPTLINAVLPDGVLTAYQPIYAAGFKPAKLRSGLYYLGSDAARVTVEMFGSYTCPECRAYYQDVILNLFDKLEAGQIRFVFIPLSYLGNFDSTNMSKAVLCAGEQDRYWEMHDVMFDWANRYGPLANDVNRATVAAVQLGLRPELFRTCMSNPATQTTLDGSEQTAASRGLETIPAIYIDDDLILSNSGTPPSLAELRRLIEVKLAARP